MSDVLREILKDPAADEAVFRELMEFDPGKGRKEITVSSGGNLYRVTFTPLQKIGNRLVRLPRGAKS